jgi:mannan endo-1,4-beta-mannosidase
MAKALAGYKALAAWEVGNELEGFLKHDITDSNPCFDTHKVSNYGAGWAAQEITMKELLQFINRHADAIHSAAPGSLVTFGDFQEASNTDAFSYTFNHYKDECLIAAGGKSNGRLDFYQVSIFRKNVI